MSKLALFKNHFGNTDGLQEWIYFKPNTHFFV